MDMSGECAWVVTGHDKCLALWDGNLEKVWERKPESARKTGAID